MQHEAPNQQSQVSRRQALPTLRKLAIWHPESGVIFSPYTRMLPSRVTCDSTSKHREHLIYPRMLHDQDIYLAFYPRKNWDNGALFSTLAPPNLASHIVEAPGSTTHAPLFILSDDLCQAWAELENFLLDISDYLFSTYPETKYLPEINYPTWPNQCGYREAHKSKMEAFACLKRTQHAFRLLSAFVSFTLSLWVTEYEDDCFDRPFQLLMSRHVDPIPPIHLDYLRDSVVCRILPGLRPGGFLNPYYTKWGRVMFRFCRFCVPFWMIWGHEKLYKNVVPLDNSIKAVFLPNDWYIEKIKERLATFSWLVLPDAKGFGPAPAQAGLPPTPSDTCIEYSLPTYAILENVDACVDRSPNETWEIPNDPDKVDRTLVVDTYRTAQRPKESWDSFRVRMEEGLARRKAAESEKDRQRRESLEANARENGYSKKTTVFTWEEDEVDRGFYRRTKVDRVDVAKEWSYHTKHQRFFWSHRNEWDLVHHIPRNPPGHRAETPVEDLEIDDDRFNFLYSKVPPRKPDDMFKSKSLSLNRIEIQDGRGIGPLTGQYTFTFSPAMEYLKLRHGFSTSLIDTWHPELHDSSLPKKLYLKAANWKFAHRRLGYGEKSSGQVARNPEELKSVVNFCNICVAVKSKNIRCSDLPASWDLGSNAWLEQGLLRLRVQTVKYEKGDMNLFIIRPESSSWDPSSWYIATTSPTAVLLVFRKRWLTMHEIATAFLDLGIPFHTVEERMREDSPLPPYRYRPRGLDARPKGFQPIDSDYLAYVGSRDEIFKSPRARTLRLRGGIVGRLALEAVPNVMVLDGPSFCDDIIGSTDNAVFVDDFISDNDLEIVSGVYRVSTTDSNAASAHLSWWPKHGTWEKSGYFADQWSPDAEAFYINRVQMFQKKEWNLKGATSWKESLKYDRAQMEYLYGGSEALAAEFIKRHFK